jgi:hypothetical protein
MNTGVDLAREERVKKCDMIIEQLENVVNSSNLRKIMQKNNDVK